MKIADFKKSTKIIKINPRDYDEVGIILLKNVDFEGIVERVHRPPLGNYEFGIFQKILENMNNEYSTLIR